MLELAPTRFAKRGDVHLAYQVIGSGAIDILFVDTWVHHVEAVWDFPDFARFLRRFGSFGRLIHFDRRGTGLSDPVPLDALPDFDTQVEDVVAILDAAAPRRLPSSAPTTGRSSRCSSPPPTPSGADPSCCSRQRRSTR